MGSIERKVKLPRGLGLSSAVPRKNLLGSPWYGPDTRHCRFWCTARIVSRTMKRGEDLEHGDRLDRPVVEQIDRHGWVVDEVLSDTGNVCGDRDAELAEGC